MHIRGCMSTNMFYFTLPIRTKIINSEAVLLLINNIYEFIFQNGPLSRINFTFKY